MGRVSTDLYLTAAQRVQLENCVREHNFVRLDEMGPKLAALGIHMPRSTLHRYVKRLRGTTIGLQAKSATVVIVVDLRTGQQTTLFTRLDAADIARDVAASITVAESPTS